MDKRTFIQVLNDDVTRRSGLSCKVFELIEDNDGWMMVASVNAKIGDYMIQIPSSVPYRDVSSVFRKE